MKKLDLIIVGVIIFFGLTARLYKIDIPLADFHSWRQADTAAVARNFTRTGYDLLHPRYDDLANIQTGKYNPKGYRMVEFPFYNALTALSSQITRMPIHIAGRLITVGFSLLVIFCIYYLLKYEIGTLGAIFGSLFFALQPFIVYYTRVVLPDGFSMSLAMISITIAYRYRYGIVNKTAASKCPCVFISASFLAAAILVKPTAVFFLLPFIYLYLSTHRRASWDYPGLLIYPLITILPTLLWRVWIGQFPEGIPASSWLFYAVNTGGALTPIFMRPAFFRWIFYERIFLIISGAWSFILIFIGTISIKPKSYFIPIVSISSLFFLLIFQGGNVQHDYYQIMILPTLALLVGVGASTILKSKSIFHPVIAPIGVVSILFLGMIFSFNQVKDHYNTDGRLLTMSRLIQTLTPFDALIATDTTGDTTLLYLSDRRGFPALTDSYEVLKTKGIQYVVTSSQSEKILLNKIGKKIFENSDFGIYSL